MTVESVILDGFETELLKIKRCAKCGLEKPISEFHRDVYSKDQFQRRCKKCACADRKQHYQAHREESIACQKRYKKEHPIEIWVWCTVKNHNIKHLQAEVLASAKRTKYCPICRCELTYSNGRTGCAATLDRIYNGETGPQSKADDFWIICIKCNRTKSDRSMDDFVKYCGMVWDKFKKE